MGNMDIEQRVISVFWNKFQFHAERLSETQKADSLLNPEIGFKAVDLFVLYMELEKELHIKFDEKDVIDSRFDVYDNIINSVTFDVRYSCSYIMRILYDRFLSILKKGGLSYEKAIRKESSCTGRNNDCICM